MSDAQVVDQVVDQPLAPEQVEVKKMKKLLTELLSTVTKIDELRDDKMFRFLSKPARNALIQDMIELSECVYDSAKRARNLLKKDKRVRVPDEIIDLLIKSDLVKARAVSDVFSTTSTDDSDEDEPTSDAIQVLA